MHKHCFRFLLRFDSNTQEEFKTNIMGNVKVAHGLLHTPKIMFSICDPPQDFNAKGEGSARHAFTFKQKNLF